MDVHAGEILGLGSYPDLRPRDLHAPDLSPTTVRLLNSEETGAPQTNRAIQGLYPTGSTFKLITAAAALEDGLITPDETRRRPGRVHRRRRSRSRTPATPQTGRSRCTTALQVSSDVFFYKLGARGRRRRGAAVPIQDWAENLGLGSRDRDRPAGRARRPDPDAGVAQRALRGRRHRPPVERRRQHQPLGRPGRPAGDPLQMAVAYSTIANGGNVVRPHLAQMIEDPAGRVVQEFDPAPRGSVTSTSATGSRSSTASTPRRWSRAGRLTRSSAASRWTSRARREPRSAASTRRTSRGTSRSLLPGSRGRGRGDDRGGRLRRRRGGSGGVRRSSAPTSTSQRARPDAAPTGTASAGSYE